MNIEQWDFSRLGQLADLYNVHASEVPYDYPVSQEGFLSSVTEPLDDLEGQTILVATEAGKPRGYVHAGVIAGDDESGRRGVIRSMAFPRDRRGVGQALLDNAQAYLSDFTVHRFQAFTAKYGYSCAWHRSLKSPWEHIYALLGSNGYHVDGEWGLVAAWGNYELREPTLPDSELEVQLEDAPIYPGSASHGSLPTVVVRVFRDGEQVGINETCPYYLPFWEQAPQNVCFTRGMEIKESERGRGIGRYIMERALFEMQASGCCSAILNLHPRNFAALMLYVSMGYRIAYRMCHMVKGRS